MLASEITKKKKNSSSSRSNKSKISNYRGSSRSRKIKYMGMGGGKRRGEILFKGFSFYLHAQSVKLFFVSPTFVHPAWQGEKYVMPLAPHTGWTSLTSHSQPKLHEAVRLILKGSLSLLWAETTKS